MQEFKKTIINTFGEKGKVWLSDLNTIILSLQQHWHLKEIKPVSNLSYNFVAKALDDKDQPAILKISCDNQLILSEASALEYFDGKGAVQLLDRNLKYNALLLQQAIPGIALKDLYPSQFEKVADAYVGCMKKIHNHAVPHSGFPTVNTWLDDLDKPQSQIPPALLDKAIQLKNRLQSSQKNHRLLHGDLHLDNILLHGEEWLCIDPKGIIGEPEFEIAAFDYISASELDTATKELFTNRIEKVAQKAELSPKRIQDWVFVRLILSAIWSIEGKESPRKALHLANLLNNL